MPLKWKNEAAASYMEMPQLSQRCMIAIANDHMVKHFNFEQLPGFDDFTGNLNVRVTWL